MTIKTLAMALLLCGTCASVAGEDTRGVPGGAAAWAQALGKPSSAGGQDPLQAPAPVGSGPGDMAPPAPFPFPGYRGDIPPPHVAAVPAPSIMAPDATAALVACGSRCPGRAETAVGGPLGDLDLMRRIIQGGSEDPSPGPAGAHAARGDDVADRANYGDLVGHWVKEAMRQAVPAALPAGARRDVPAEGYGAVVAMRPPTGQAAAQWPGDPCSFERGGAVEVVGHDGDLGSLVRYAAGPSRATDACADGTLAFVPGWVVSAWPATGDVLARSRAFGSKASAAAARILADDPPGR